MTPQSAHPGKAGIAHNQARAVELDDGGSKSSEIQQNKHTQRKTFNLVTTPTLLALSFVVQLGLLLYANHIDSHPERFGGLKYTDVDWRVVSDGARLIFRPDEDDGNIARGWLVRYLGLSIGDPYERATFRYTPLLALLVSPSLIHPLFGRLLLVLISLCIPPLLLSLPAPAPAPASSSRSRSRSSADVSRVSGPTTLVALDPAPALTPARVPFWAVHGLWTLNPFVLNITTRGSPESVICLLVVLLLVSLRKGKEVQAAVWLGLAVSWKIYPAIYVPAIWSFLARPRPRPRSASRNKHEEDAEGGWFGWRVWRFGVVAAMTFGIVNGILWAIWGLPFLEHTYLYHLTRQDHRHNFSPYFYPIYLSFYTKLVSSSLSSSSSMSISSGAATMMSKIIRNPLTSFFPQLSLVLLAGFGLESASTLEFALFMQTAVFVVFNKVCTSQYFMWFLPLLPPILPSLSNSNSNSNSGHNSRSRSRSRALSARKTTLLVGGWVAAQAIWLGTAYQLELMGQDVFWGLWVAGLGLFGVSIWVLGELIDAFGFGFVSGSGGALDQVSDRDARREKAE
ncbi:hypothetical protein IAU59_005948 [Kwoniella sp. CBS 9459]